MDGLDEIIPGSASGSGCTEVLECNGESESSPVQFPLWLISLLGLVSLFLIFCIILCIVLLCRFSRVDRPKKRYALRGDKRHGRKAHWNDIFDEIHTNFKTRDKNDNEDIGPRSFQAIPTVNSFKAKRTQEETATFINERREDDEDENELSILPHQARGDCIIVEGERQRPLAVQDPTYDRLAGTGNSNNTDSVTVTAIERQSENESGIKEDINRRSTVISSHQSLNRTIPKKEERDYDDVLTSSMGPGRRLTTLSNESKDRNSLYYIYIPKDGDHPMDDVYPVPNTQEDLIKSQSSIDQVRTYCNLHSGSLDGIDDKALKGRTTLTKSVDLDAMASDAEKDSSQTGLGPTYLKIIPPKGGSETLSHYEFIDDESKGLNPTDQRESRVYQAIDDDLVQSQAEPTQNVYTLPNEYDDIKGQPPSRDIDGDTAERLYCNIDDGSPCYDDVDIYTVPTDPSQPGSGVAKGKHNSIYYTSIDDLREEGGSGGGNDTGGYSYAATHELVSPSGHSKGEEEKGEIKSDARFTNDSGYTYAAGLQLVALKPSMGSVKEKPKEQSVPNPLYSTKSLSLPHDHSYENTNRFLPPRRHSEKEYVTPKTQWFRSGSLNDILDIDKSPEEDEKEYLESSKEWVKKKNNGRFQIDSDSSAYTPVMARLMYNHDYMLPSTVSHSQPADSEFEASTHHADWEMPEKWRTMSLNASKQGEEKKSKGKKKDSIKKKSETPVGGVFDEKHKYQNWKMFNQSK
ncbi:PREDICTED: uncharacterized protein LOC109581330 [Amphimedon queenslandica]|uniref:Uncharacterized protein n=1 Tax=Amphimedon queenslandica TaxID=400682 RepID=A0A1X7V2S0_AMPQE|nr:PREDICTED: uncharacterized protein LOC109581330 [Amphimedon queenslandica]|eukprot:XP_019850931.1 PREDICTED: uncharacterized protein LOC109581330 [Amphimedon queenslandica]